MEYFELPNRSALVIVLPAWFVISSAWLVIVSSPVFHKSYSVHSWISLTIYIFFHLTVIFITFLYLLINPRHPLLFGTWWTSSLFYFVLFRWTVKIFSHIKWRTFGGEGSRVFLKVTWKGCNHCHRPCWSTSQKVKFSIKDFYSKCEQICMVTSNEEILNGKLHFLCAVVIIL